MGDHVVTVVIPSAAKRSCPSDLRAPLSARATSTKVIRMFRIPPRGDVLDEGICVRTTRFCITISFQLSALSRNAFPGARIALFLLIAIGIGRDVGATIPDW